TEAAGTAEQPPSGPPSYSEMGADTCLICHLQGAEDPALPILAPPRPDEFFKTKHAQALDKRTPFAREQCEACHGPGGDHINKGEPPRFFGKNSPATVKESNAICLGCHQKQSRISWIGSAHERNDVACMSCHSIHFRDRTLISSEQATGVCYDCHQKQRADFYKASAHPVRYKKMGCSSCHNPHGSFGSKLMTRTTVNETCYGCHAEKRGPFLWEHAPVAEDCSLCHVPHGSNNPALLARRPPLLCQQCHSQAGHTSFALTPGSLPSGTPSGYLLAKGCLNCHSQVHGSNHPSGVTLMR
ncbi:MAG: hypothetical protein AMJ69_10590, partial [Gammaproteobacteria bacterium SG8_47]